MRVEQAAAQAEAEGLSLEQALRVIRVVSKLKAKLRENKLKRKQHEQAAEQQASGQVPPLALQPTGAMADAAIATNDNGAAAAAAAASSISFPPSPLASEADATILAPPNPPSQSPSGKGTITAETVQPVASTMKKKNKRRSLVLTQDEEEKALTVLQEAEKHGLLPEASIWSISRKLSWCSHGGDDVCWVRELDGSVWVERIFDGVGLGLGLGVVKIGVASIPTQAVSGGQTAPTCPRKCGGWRHH